jgi:hypothetical protein
VGAYLVVVPLHPGHVAGLVRVPLGLAVVAERVAASGSFAAASRQDVYWFTYIVLRFDVDIQISVSPAAVDVMITIFSDFCQFSAKKLAFFSKTNVMIAIFAKTNSS